MNIAAFPSETDPPSTIGWPSEHSKLLKKLTIDGYSFAQISAKLWDEFRVSYSRNACIGKASRLGLVAKKVSRPTITRSPKTAPNPRQKKPILPSADSQEAARLRCVEVIPRDVPVIELQPGQCRWPYGEGPYTFCARPATEGSSYCLPHFCLSIGPGTESERDAGRVSGSVGA